MTQLLENHPASSTLMWKIPYSSERCYRQLLDQQMWCFGQDIQIESGNYLLSLGFERRRFKEHHEQISCYTLTRKRYSISLWPSAVVYREKQHGELLLERFKFKPIYLSSSQDFHLIRRLKYYSQFKKPSTSEEIMHSYKLLMKLMKWLTRYEVNLQKKLGKDYRQNTIDSWGEIKKKPVFAAEEMIRLWKQASLDQWEQALKYQPEIK